MKSYDSMHYRQFTNRAEVEKAVNTLSGILKGIQLDNRISLKENKELLHWCDAHEYLSRSYPFKDIFNFTKKSLADDYLSKEEILDILWLCNQTSKEGGYYDSVTLKLQQLQGICHGILADGVVKEIEVIELNKWLEKHDDLKSYYPYDEIYSIVTDVLSDGKIDKDEQLMLKAVFSQFCDIKNVETKMEIMDEIQEAYDFKGVCAVAPELIFVNHQFCFTGKSGRAERNEIKEVIQQHGGKYINGVSGKTNYLIVGDEGNTCWSYACYGRKVEKAMKLRIGGQPIQIVHENDFWDKIEDLE